jgi:hypothetical protein
MDLQIKDSSGDAAAMHVDFDDQLGDALHDSDTFGASACAVDAGNSPNRPPCPPDLGSILQNFFSDENFSDKLCTKFHPKSNKYHFICVLWTKSWIF